MRPPLGAVADRRPSHARLLLRLGHADETIHQFPSLVILHHAAQTAAVMAPSVLPPPYPLLLRLPPLKIVRIVVHSVIVLVPQIRSAHRVGHESPRHEHIYAHLLPLALVAEVDIAPRCAERVLRLARTAAPHVARAVNLIQTPCSAHCLKLRIYHICSVSFSFRQLIIFRSAFPYKLRAKPLRPFLKCQIFIILVESGV